MQNKLPVFVCALLLFLSGCKTLDADLSVPKKEIPAAFQSVPDSVNIADINWRQYFDDSLLLRLIDTALANNFDLQMTLQRIEIARANVKIAKTALLPQVDVGAIGSMRKFGFYTMDGAGNATTDITPGQLIPEHLPDIFIGAQASWEVDIWGKLRNQKRSALAQYLASIEGTNFVITSLIADVAVAYYELVALDNMLEIIRQTIAKQQEALEVIKMQKEAGKANELAVQQFLAQLLNSQALEKETEQQIIETENLLNFLLGRYPQPVERQKEILFREIPIKPAAGIPSQLLQNRPDIREAEFQLQASHFDVKAARAAFFPSFSIMAGAGFQAFNPEYLFLSPASIAYSAFGTLIAPLVNLRAIKAEFKAAKANQLQAVYNYQKTIVSGYVEVANALSNIQNLQQINAIKKQQTETLTLAVETSAELYKSAKASYLEVLFAQQTALESNLELVDASKRQRIAAVSLYKELGGGWK